MLGICVAVPDENFAREAMQLETVGLDMLNLDGTLVLDRFGNNIPTCKWCPRLYSLPKHESFLIVMFTAQPSATDDTNDILTFAR